MGCSGRLLCFFVVLVISSVAAQGQSTEGFISIDCGSSTNYTDSTTGLPYVTDDQFTDTGVNYPISNGYEPDSRQLHNVRSFPNATRSCYVLKQVTPFQKYIVRADFFYGNYDGENRANPDNPLQFDLYLDTNYWMTVNVDKPYTMNEKEVIMVASGNSISVCLVKTGSATPFVSVLELRPLADGMYPAVSSSEYQLLCFRYNVGPALGSSVVRYPDDPYDRLWWPSSYSTLIEKSTTSTVSNANDDYFKPPSAVMQTAAIPPDNSSVMEFSWNWNFLVNFADWGYPSNAFFVNFFFAELEASIARTFALYVNGDLLTNVTPSYLSEDYWYNSEPLPVAPKYSWSLSSSGMSTFPPILNAMEVFTAMNFTPSTTNSDDVDAINAIKQQYQVKRSWMADPCAPQKYPWDGLNCSYGTSPSRITALYLSSTGLNGIISSNFAKLTALKYLNLPSCALAGEIFSSFANLTEIIDLSYNNLTGRIPDALGTLPLLQVLNLTGNNLMGTIPNTLLERSQQGTLILRYDGNPNLCSNQASCKSKKLGRSTVVILSLVPAVLVLLFVVISIGWRARRRSQPNIGSPPNRIKGHQNILLQLENRNFTYKELEKITKRFTNVLGRGGFGSVFLGCLEDGTQVAVKMRSQTSSQGTKEFLAEAQNLTKIHHKNLVSLVGYCLDKDHLALVYEFILKGTLQENLRGETHIAVALSWAQRINIAVEAAQGLEYLHKGIKPPIIHRDVKSSNILLSESLEAKIADFGLSRTFNDHNKLTHVSTAVVGTPGYLDPEYYSSFQPSEKSDVYSFGVVLFELITGQLPVFQTGDELYTSLAQWAREKLAANCGIEDIVDARLQGQSNSNSIGKAADVALRCIEPAARTRPTMSDVVVELKESLAMEVSFQRLKSLTTTGSTCNTFPSSSYVSASGSSTRPLEVESFAAELHSLK